MNSLEKYETTSKNWIISEIDGSCNLSINFQKVGKPRRSLINHKMEMIWVPEIHLFQQMWLKRQLRICSRNELDTILAEDGLAEDVVVMVVVVVLMVERITGAGIKLVLQCKGVWIHRCIWAKRAVLTWETNGEVVVDVDVVVVVVLAVGSKEVR